MTRNQILDLIQKQIINYFEASSNNNLSEKISTCKSIAKFANLDEKEIGEILFSNEDKFKYELENFNFNNPKSMTLVFDSINEICDIK